MGIFAIRVFGGGALLGAEPSPHTLKTPFFPLELYRRDEARACQLAQRLGSMDEVRHQALKYVLSIPEITSAIIGFGQPVHVDSAAQIASEPLWTQDELTSKEELRNQSLTIPLNPS